MKSKAKEIHLQETKKLQQILKQKKEQLSIKKDSISNTLRNGDYKKEGCQLNLSSFNKILEFNQHEAWIVVEPKITFANLCTFTLGFGLVPPVVPEFTSITVGGAVMGGAIESSSHRYGQVNDNCLEYTLLLGNGELVLASPYENSDLFYAVSGSYGTLAILTAVKLRLIAAKKWVRLTYHRFHDVHKAIEILTTPHKADFVEGIIYNFSEAVVISGQMSEYAPGKLHRQNRPWSPWYAQHVHVTKNREEYMTTKEYLFRYDRGAFWMGRYVRSFRAMIRLLFHLGIPKIKQQSLNPVLIFRLLFGWAFSSKKLYRIWHNVPRHISENLFFIHDFYTPSLRADDVIHRFMELTGIFPIWLCPIKGTQTPQFLSPHFGGSNFLNIGLYGIPQTNLPIPQLSAQLEKELISYGGRKMLYSFTYYDRESFSKIYSETKYNELRKTFFAEKAFPSLYNKVLAN